MWLLRVLQRTSEAPPSRPDPYMGRTQATVIGHGGVPQGFPHFILQKYMELLPCAALHQADGSRSKHSTLSRRGGRKTGKPNRENNHVIKEQCPNVLSALKEKWKVCWEMRTREPDL